MRTAATIADYKQPIPGLEPGGTTAPETATFVSFDGGVREMSRYQVPDRYRTIERHAAEGPWVPRGGGYSYAAASFGAGSLVLDMRRFNRLLRFDQQTRLIEVEAGVTLGDLFAFAAARGLWLPVQPGYPAITVGGCVAANVHGKNPLREGTFVRHVEGLCLFHPRHGTLRLDRAHDPALFDLTCGGYGLTGLVLSATLRLAPLPGPAVRVQRIPIVGLAQGLEQIQALASSSTFAYTWHDGAPRPSTFGRGFVFQGQLLQGSSTAAATPRYRCLTAATRGRLPFSLWAKPTARWMTAAFRHLEALKPSLTEVPLFETIFPFASRGHYFRLFGRRGLAEYQVLVPHDAAHDFLKALQAEVVRRQAPLVMVSMKLFSGSSRFLRFEGDGVCVTLNLTRSRPGLNFLEVLDRLTTEAGGLPHIIKDSRLPAAVVRSQYPEYESFRRALRRHDPERLLRSELSARLEL